MSRLLMLMPSVPARLDSGARMRNRGLLQLLAANHEVDVIAFGDDASSLRGIARCAEVVGSPARSTAHRVLDLLGSDLPDMAHRLWSHQFAAAVVDALRQRDYDAVQAEGIEMARYLALVPPELRIYDAHNAEFLLQRRLAGLAPALGHRMYSRLQWHRLARFERSVIRTSRLTLSVSDHDANQLLALAGADTCVHVVPNGIDVAAYEYVEPAPEQVTNVLFVGTLDFRPNAEALRWFVREVLSRSSDVRLFCVGQRPPEWLIRVGQHNDRVAVTGYVEDERPYLRRSMALVLPLTTGGGSRLKALIAMASGLPIVSTRFGMEGLDAEPDTHFLLAESADEFVAAIGRLRDDVDLRVRLARAGRALVETHYDWQALHERVRAAYAWLE
jgi:glycosyltransferase involved in cell wall biosynthesis